MPFDGARRAGDAAVFHPKHERFQMAKITGARPHAKTSSTSATHTKPATHKKADPKKPEPKPVQGWAPRSTVSGGGEAGGRGGVGGGGEAGGGGGWSPYAAGDGGGGGGGE